MGALELPINLMHVFGLWEEAREPRENPHKFNENMQTPNGDTEPSCCDVTCKSLYPSLNNKLLIIQSVHINILEKTFISNHSNKALRWSLYIQL